jgi:hypothetical protein
MEAFLQIMEEHDSIYHAQLARAARVKADSLNDPDVARRLRETAIKHERMARRLLQQSEHAT